MVILLSKSNLNKMANEESRLMLIPSEIRLMIYALLLDDHQQNVFEIRNEDPDAYSKKGPHLRTGYLILGGRGLLRRSRSTTYRLVTKTDMHTSIMSVNRKIHEETSHVLYGNRTFSFGRDVEAIVPFFSDLTLQTRPLVHEMSVVKRGSVYTRDYDRCEWNGLCEFIRKNMCLGSIKLVVEGGRPALGWDGLKQYSKGDFETLSRVKYEALDWVWDLLSIRGIRNLDVSSDIHHIPPSQSGAMAFFASFSSSIETGFADFLRSEMLVGA